MCLLPNRLGADEASAGLDVHNLISLFSAFLSVFVFFVLARALPSMCSRANHKGEAERIAEPDVKAIPIHVEKACHIT